MARFHAKSAAVLVDEFDFSGLLSSVRIAVNNPTPKVTAFDDADETYVEGKPDFTIDHNGMFDTSGADFDDEMFIDLAVPGRQVGVYGEGFGATGNLGYEGKTNALSNDRQGRVSEVLLLNVSWKGTEPIVTTQVLYRNSALTSSETGSSIQVGALSATQEMTCVLRAIAAPGGSTPTIDVLLRSDDAEDMVGNTTRHTFSQLTDQGFEVAVIAGAITDTWWDIDVTESGTGTWNILVTIGIGPKAG